MKYVEYIETDGSEIAFPLTNAVISSVDCQIHFEYVPLNGTVHYDAFYTFLFGLNNKITFRTIGAGYQVNNPYQIIFGDTSRPFSGTAPSFQVGTKYSCILDKYGINVNGTQYNFTSPATSISNLNCVFNAEYNGTRITRCPVARYISLKVVLNGNDICDYKAAVDDNNVPCFYDEVSNTYAYHIGTGTPTAGPAIATDTKLVPVNKYKLYTSNIQKTYNGSTQINKMYVGNDLVYRALPTTTPAPSCGSGIPSDEVWYKANQVTDPYRPHSQDASWFKCSADGTGSSNYIISNTYDSTDGWYKIKWSCDFVRSAGSGWYMQQGITEVIYPDCFEVEDAECWNYCTGITKITYGNSVTELGEGACPPNVSDIYMYTTTPPDLNPSQDQRGDYFRNHNSSRPITLHLPYGSDWSGVTLPNYVTVVYDLCV